MSNIGKRLIQIPENIQISIVSSTFSSESNQAKNKLILEGPLGHQNLTIPDELEINLLKDDKLGTTRLQIFPKNSPLQYNQDKTSSQNKKNGTMQKLETVWGTFRSIVSNTIIGLSQGFQMNLKIVGVGYRASLEKNEQNKIILVLKLGFSHLINLNIPDTISISCPKPTRIILRSNNLNDLMQYAALIKSYKEPEPYKGKGILYKGEKIRRKEGKKK